MHDYNIIIDVVSAILVGVIVVSNFSQHKTTTPDTRLLNLLMLCSLSAFITDIPGLLLDGTTFYGARGLLWFFDTIYWLPHALYGWLWLMFTDYQLFRSKKRIEKFSIPYAVPMFISIVLIVTNVFTGKIFTINSANEYTRGAAYYFYLIPYFYYVAAALLLTIHGYLSCKNAEQRRRCLLLPVYMFLPICGIALEIFAYGVTWVWPFTALSLLMVYVNMQQQYIVDEQLFAANEEAKAAEIEKALIDSRIKIMLSQIQPHFLYNSLAVIQALCESEPDAAAEAMTNFSDFLRSNMDSLTMDKPIAFERELNHAKNYLALEKLRYEDAINIEYDIRVTLFRLPTLTLQPMVENAVRHGIRKREQGGTIKIASRETERAFIVTVTDDGIGFDVTKAQEDGRTHIGIDNVRNRLREMCCGSLTINSTVGVGTTAVITIPKGGQDV